MYVRMHVLPRVYLIYVQFLFSIVQTNQWIQTNARRHFHVDDVACCVVPFSSCPATLTSTHLIFSLMETTILPAYTQVMAMAPLMVPWGGILITIEEVALKQIMCALTFILSNILQLMFLY